MSDLPAGRRGKPSSRGVRTAVGLAFAVGGGLGAALLWALGSVSSADPQIEIAVVAGFGLIALILAGAMVAGGRSPQPYQQTQTQPRQRERERETDIERARLEAAWTAHLGQVLITSASRLGRDRPEVQVHAVEAALATGGIAGIESAITALAAPASRSATLSAPQVQAQASMTIARRVLALVVRVLRQLDALERDTEDPYALKALFAIDEQVTRVRRSIETLAVLGGVAPRTAPRPVAVHTLLRQAVAEIEDYRRVQLLPPVTGRVHGVAAADVIHLIAELVENATKFSRPDTEVAVRVQEVAAGLAIDIDDRGLGMERQECERACALLAGLDPHQVAQRLNDGQLGFLASAHFAARHGIAVRVESNVVGGIHALVLLPHALLEAAPAPAAPAAVGQEDQIGQIGVGHIGHAGAGYVAGSEPADLTHERIPARVLTPAAHAAPSPVPLPIHAPARPETAGPAGSTGSSGRPPLPRREGSYLPQNAAPESASSEPARGGSDEAVFSPGLLAGFRSGYQSGTETWAGEDGVNEYEPPQWER